MSVYTRPDSPYYWLFLEPTKQKENTKIRIGTTRHEKKDSRTIADALYHKRMLELANGVHRATIQPITFDAWVTIYDRDHIATHKGRVRERQILPRLRVAFGALLLTEIDRDVVLAWRAKRLTTPTIVERFGGTNGTRRVIPPPSAATVKREINLLKSILKAAVPKYLTASPIAGVGGLGASQKIVVRQKRVMSTDEEAKMLAAFQNPADALVFMIAVDSLLRLSDVIDLRKVDVERGALRALDPKNGVEIDVPLSPRVRAAIAALPENSSAYLFPHRRTAEADDPAEAEAKRVHSYVTLCRRVAHRAGVDWGKKVGGNTFHWSTRRTGAIRLLRTGTSSDIVSVVQAIGGWVGSEMLLKEYNEVTQDEMRAAIEKLHGVSK